jgi:diguanylate cyclase (GGDEF)-like protein
MPRIKLALWQKVFVIVGVPLLAAFLATNLIGWQLFQTAINAIEAAFRSRGEERAAILSQLEGARLSLLGASVIIAGMALLSVALTVRKLNHPIDQLKRAARRISGGDLQTRVPDVGDELGDLATALESTREHLRTSLAEVARQAKMEAELRAESHHENELSILLALSQLLLGTTDENTILRLAVETTAELLNADFSSIVLPDEQSGALVIRAVYGWPQSEIGQKLGPGTESQTGYTLLQGHPVAVYDYGLPLPFKIQPDPKVASGLSVPMIHEGHILGALFIHTSRPRHFEQEDIRLLTLVANQTAAALERARLYAQSLVQSSELRTLARIGEALNRAETAGITLRLVLTEALKLVNNDQGCIILVEPDDFTLRLYTWLGIPDRSVQEFNARRFQKYHGIFARSILRGEVVEIHDHHNGAESAFEFTDTLLAQKVNVPLKTEDKTIGVLALHGLPVNDQARRMLLALADLAATAIAKMRLYERTQMLAITDDLTGLYNRRGFFELGQREFERARRFERPLAAIMFDIDFFKAINDTYGHSVGNQVLADLARLCQHHMREVDLLGRYGGEEFVVLLPETSLEGATQAAERLRRAVAEAVYKTGRGDINITISVGVAILPARFDSLTELIDQADSALYSAKRSGRNTISVWSPDSARDPSRL